jgi:hypothetical protein
MDKFENRLKRDAEDIDTGDSAALRARIDASIRGTKQIRPVPESRDPGINLWWASSITGLATALIVIVIVNVNQPEVADTPVAPVAQDTVPEFIEELPIMKMPPIKSADFTNPLEDELLRLQADLEKAEQTVRDELRRSF